MRATEREGRETYRKSERNREREMDRERDGKGRTSEKHGGSEPIEGGLHSCFSREL